MNGKEKIIGYIWMDEKKIVSITTNGKKIVDYNEWMKKTVRKKKKKVLIVMNEWIKKNTFSIGISKRNEWSKVLKLRVSLVLFFIWNGKLNRFVNFQDKMMVNE